ncbi:MAG: hypothetical protein AAFV80_10695, partial [Bacteroidota bacterium]
MKKIADWKAQLEQQLPKSERVIARNKIISGNYAAFYQKAPKLYKWAGMAAFASHHVGMALLPLVVNKGKIKGPEELAPDGERGWSDDLNLLRLLNNAIYDDIGWVHERYLDPAFGLSGLTQLLGRNEHYQGILKAFQLIDQGKQMMESGHQAAGQAIIWKANVDILRHEQFEVVQPIFTRLNQSFTRVLSFCASLDFDARHTKTDWKTHSSFFWFTLLRSPKTLATNKFMPNLIDLEQRWYWIERSLVPNWQKTERT